jgi:hypothetical protein
MQKRTASADAQNDATTAAEESGAIQRRWSANEVR